MVRQPAEMEALPRGEVEQRISDLLVFDARSVDLATRADIRRLLPQLLLVSRAWSDHFERYGCIGCLTGRPDSTPVIAARLRRRGLSWPAILADIGRGQMTVLERRTFRSAVRYHLTHPEAPERESPAHLYGGGGFCMQCQTRMRRQLSKIIHGVPGERDTNPKGELGARRKRSANGRSVKLPRSAFSSTRYTGDLPRRGHDPNDGSLAGTQQQ